MLENMGARRLCLGTARRLLGLKPRAAWWAAQGEFMSKALMGALAGVAALATTVVSATTLAQDTPDVVARDPQGELVMRDDAAGFGKKGQLAISTDAVLSFERTTQSGADSVTSLSILPAVDYFVIENLSVGGVIGVTYQKAGDTKATSFQLGPRVGYNFEFSPLLSVWPKLGLSYSYNKVKEDLESDTPGEDVTVTLDNSALALNLFVPVMLHPAPHFFAGFGPFLDTQLNGDNRATTWGLRLTVGGWL
jgi:hypothetical protein